MPNKGKRRLYELPGNAAIAIAAVSKSTEVALDWSHGRLRIGGVLVDLPDSLVGEDSELFGIAGMLPSVPRGDARDRLLWRALQETRDEADAKGAVLDLDLYEKLPELLPANDPDGQEALAGALRERHYYREKARFLLPLQTDLPHGFNHTRMSKKNGSLVPQPYTGYRMFAGDLLPFLTWQGDGSDEELIQRLLDALNDDQQITRLDRMLLDAARKISGVSHRQATAATLIDKNQARVQQDFAYGAFCQPQLDRFRLDLATILATGLPRPDLVRWVTILISLHVSVLMYRIAVVQGEALDRAIAGAHRLPASESANHTCTSLAACPLAGRIRFRAGTGSYRPVSLRDDCHTSWKALDGRQLIAMPATLVTASLAARVWAALGGPDPTRPNLGALANALRGDDELRKAFNAGCAAVAVLHHHAYWVQSTKPDKGMPAPAEAQLLNAAGLGTERFGLLALRDDVLRMRRTDLRHQSRDVVNQLMLHPVGGMLARNGSITFYEVDEELLTLLVRLVCGDDQMPFDEFTAGLADYGLVPQDALERATHTDALDRLGLLIRYSDAGESTYVHYDR
jgi:hypothetical protein